MEEKTIYEQIGFIVNEVRDLHIEEIQRQQDLLRDCINSIQETLHNSKNFEDMSDFKNEIRRRKEDFYDVVKGLETIKEGMCYLAQEIESIQEQKLIQKEFYIKEVYSGHFGLSMEKSIEMWEEWGPHYTPEEFLM